MRAYPEYSKKPDVILSHDWLTGMRGGEHVLEILCDWFPSAPIFTMIHNKSVISDTINSHPVTTSSLQKIPGIFSNYRNFLPVMPSVYQAMKTPKADLLISTNHCVAKGLRIQPETKHLCYCFTPMRYAWTFYEEYFGSNPVKAMMIKPLLAALRSWDKKTSANVDRFVAISAHVQKRIKKFYNRESDIVFPPVETDKYTPADNPGTHDDFDLIVSALVPYKRVDLAVKAYSGLKRKLVVVGTGGQMNRLKSIAGNNIQLLGWQSDETILNLYRTCRMLIFPGEEDFGIVPLEAQACGKPVVAYGRGGALETVKDGETGVFFHEQTEDALRDAVDSCSSRKWDHTVIRNHSEQFSPQHFINNLGKCIDKCLRQD